jgi:hypothetical protein
VVIDLDGTDDPTHGRQQLSFFHGYYGEYMYHPLLVFDGQDGFPLAAVLRPGNTHDSHGAVAVLKRLLAAYPEALILGRADSWEQPRRIIAKVEYAAKELNQRFVVTNLSRNPQFVYDDIYVLWGDVENRIKELKLEIKADRLSCSRFLANQFRLLLHTAAYTLFWLLRRHLRGTELESAQVNTLRIKLLKIGARWRETCRRIWVHLASGYPYRHLLATTLQSLRARPV